MELNDGESVTDLLADRSAFEDFDVAAAAAKGSSDLDLRYQKFDPIGTGPLRPAVEALRAYVRVAGAEAVRRVAFPHRAAALDGRLSGSLP